MPPVRSWMANPSSKVLEENAPDGTVTDPSTVTKVPSSSARAAPMSIAWAARLGKGTKRAAAKAAAAVHPRPWHELANESIGISFLATYEDNCLRPPWESRGQSGAPHPLYRGWRVAAALSLRGSKMSRR